MLTGERTWQGGKTFPKDEYNMATTILNSRVETSQKIVDKHVARMLRRAEVRIVNVHPRKVYVKGSVSYHSIMYSQRVCGLVANYALYPYELATEEGSKNISLNSFVNPTTLFDISQSMNIKNLLFKAEHEEDNYREFNLTRISSFATTFDSGIINLAVHVYLSHSLNGEFGCPFRCTVAMFYPTHVEHLMFLKYFSFWTKRLPLVFPKPLDPSAHAIETNNLLMEEIYDLHIEDPEAALARIETYFAEVALTDLEPQSSLSSMLGFSSTLSTTIESTATNVDDLVNDVKERLDNFDGTRKNFDNLIQMIDMKMTSVDVEELDGRVKGFLTETQQGLDLRNLSNELFQGASVLALAGSTVFFYYNRTEEAKIVLVISLIAAIYFSRNELLSFSSIIVKYFTPQVKPQIGGIDDICTATCTLLVGLCCKNSSGAKLPENILKQLSSFDRVKSSFKGIVTFFLGIIDSLTSYVGLREYLPARLRNFAISEEHLRRYVNTVDDIFDMVARSTFIASEDNYDALKALDKEGYSLFQEIPSTSETSGIRIQMTDIRRKLQTIIKRMEESNFFSSGLRVEPVGLCFIGGPGTGKSQCLEHACTAILARVLKEDQAYVAATTPQVFVYNKNPASGYDDGYNINTVITTIDEFGQCVDVAGNPDNEYVSLIRYINEATCYLHMSRIEDKGVTLFKSKFVFMTSNCTKFDVASIISAEAIHRRIHFPMVTFPADEYCTDETVNLEYFSRRIDFNKLPVGELGVSSLNPKYLKFVKYDYKNHAPYGPQYSFEEVLDMVEKQHYVNVERYNQKFLELKQTFDKSFSKRPVVSEKFETPVLKAQGLINFKEFALNEEADECDYIYPNLSGRSWSLEFLRIMDSNPNDPESIFFLEAMDRASRMTHSFRGKSREYILYTLINKYGIDFMKRMENADDCQIFLFDGCEDKDQYFPRLSWENLKHDYLPEINKSVAKVYDQCKGVMYDCFVAVKDFFLKHTYIFGMMGAAGLAYGFVKSIFCINDYMATPVDESEEWKKEVDVISQSYQPKQKPRQAKAKELRNRNFTGQMGVSLDKSGVQKVDSVMRKNMYTVTFKDRDQGTRIGFATAIMGRTVMMNNHFMMIFLEGLSDPDCDITEDTRLEFKTSSSSPELKGIITTVGELFDGYYTTEESESLDLCLIALPKYFPNKANIMHMFPTTDKLNELQTVNYRLVQQTPNEKNQYMGVAKKVSKVRLNDKFLKEVVQGFGYRAATDVGDCGSLFTVMNSADQGAKIYGIHCAGSVESSYGCSNAISIEVLNAILEEVPLEFKINQPTVGEVKAQCGVVLHTGLMIKQYTVSKPVFKMGKSSIVNSRLYGAWGPAREKPAHLHTFFDNGIKIDPWDIAMTKYCGNNVHIDPRVVELVRDNYQDFLFSKSEMDRSRRVLTFEEAILGDETDPDFGSISRSTSPGYPYNQIPKQAGFTAKQPWFGNETEYDLETPLALEFRKEVEQAISDMLLNKRCEHIYMDNLKDETRPHEKVDKGNTRLFSACSMRLLVLFRMFFGAFCAWFSKNKILNGSAIGVNNYSTDWDMLAHFLNQFDNGEPSIGAGDYKGYDGSCGPQIYWALFDVIQAWYNDEFGPLRRILWLDLVNSRHIQGDLVYDWMSSLPSGHPMTSVINSMYNQFLFRYCWYRANDNCIQTLWKFDDYVYACMLGDDNVFGVIDGYRHVFNEQTIPGFMAECGMNYTSELKTVSVVKLRRLNEVEFLKRSFRYEKLLGRYVAPLSLDTIFESPYFSKKGAECDTITFTKVQSNLDEASLHGKEIFEQVKEMFIKGCIEREFPLPNKTNFLECLTRVSSREDSFF